MLKKLIPVEPDEWKPVLLATAYGFCILLSYYIVRPVRDEISTVDRGNLQILWTAVFLVMLVAVPLYSWLVSRVSRGVFIPLANRFFALNLVGFWAVLQLLPDSTRPWIDRVFYVWVSVFALFVVTVFWGFVADLFRSSQGRRVFGFIAVGASLGGIVGSAFTGQVASFMPVFALLLVSAVPLEVAAWLARALHREAEDEKRTVLRTEGIARVGGDAWSGMKTVFRDPYLRKVAGFIFLMTFASTILYFQQSFLIYDAIADRGERREFLAHMDLATNILTITTQGLFTAHIIRKIGVGLSLAAVPVLTMLGFVGLGLWPLLWTLVVLQVLYRAGRYSVTRPAREVLFTVMGREERYKSKAFVDAAVYRGGDLVNGWIYAGLAALGLGIGAISLVAAPAIALWVGLGLVLGKEQEARAAREPAERGGSVEDGAEAAPA
ncbi:MAG: MFS transporter [Gemmatimonadota bacterium]